jgi:hypothetical protein
MTCENLVPRSLFDAEVARLRAEIEALKNAGLNERQKKQAGAISTGIAQTAVNAGIQLFAVSQLPGIVNGVVSPAIKASEGKVISLAERRAAKAIAARVAPIEKAVGGFTGEISTLTKKVNGAVSTTVKNSKILSGLQSTFSKFAAKVTPILAKLAPFLRALEILFTAISVYQIIQLVRRMNNQERLMSALYAALTFAGGRLLSAAYVAGLEQKINAVGVQQKLDTTRIIGHVSGQHTQTREKIDANTNVIRSEHDRTRAGNAGQHTQTREKIDANTNVIRSEHDKTRAQNVTQHDTTRSLFSKSIEGIRAQMASFYAAIMAAIANIGSTINQTAFAPVMTKLDAVLAAIATLQNKTLERFTKLWDYMKMDRVMNVLTTAATIHNAAMLSRNLAVSLIDTIGETLGMIGLKDADGNSFDLNSILGKTAESLVVQIIGNEAYQGLSKTWRESNRIISAGAAVVMSLKSAQWAIAEGIETLQMWVARIGNGLEDDGVVTDRKYPWMREQTNVKRYAGLDKFNNALETAEGVTDNLYLTVSAGVEIGDAVTELRTTSAALKTELETAETEQEAQQTLNENNSEPPTITDEDLAEFEPEGE